MTSVLLADDHAFFRSGLSAALVAAGHQVVGAVADGMQVLETIDESNPELVILDVRMPKLDGVATLEALRSRGDTRPVIVLATQVTNDQARRLLELGVDSVLLKHGNESRLLHAIEIIGDDACLVDNQVIDSLFNAHGEVESSGSLARLSPREMMVAKGVAQGKRNREIAEMIGTTEGTIKGFLHAIYAKLGIGSRTELAMRVRQEEGSSRD